MLILAATPIGNLGDCSQRLLHALGEADFVYAEDTRHARKLLTHFGIKRSLHSYHDHSPPGVQNHIQRLLEEGRSVVYISDAGTPLVNDPGFELVQMAIKAGITVDHLPGPAAPINALVLSGIPSHEFCFLGFFPTKKSKQEALLKRLPALAMTTMFFEAPSRIRRTLTFLNLHLPNTTMALCRELTKRHQQVLRGTPAEVLAGLEVEKGEIVLVLAPVHEQASPFTLEEREEMLRKEGVKPNQIAKILSNEFKKPKREIYQQLLKNTPS